VHLSRIFPLAASFLFVAAAVAATLPRRGAIIARAASGDARLLLNHTAFLRVLCVTFLAFLCLQGPMSIFPLLVEAQGGGVRAISRMWILMLSLEVPLIAAFGWTVHRLSLRVVVLLGIASAAVRWLVSGFASNLAIVTAAQALHGVAVWGLLLGTPAYVDAIVPPRLRSTAQGVLGTVGFGIATVVSSAAAGWLTEHLGSAAPARCAGIGTLVLSIVAAWILPDPRPVQARHLDAGAAST
jgi:MFS family permease